MMAAQKHLHELLKEDQEPFLLNNYISHKRNQIKRSSSYTTLQLKKQKPPPTRTINLCKNACFFSFQNTPDIRKSPLFELSSPVKSPLRIPAKTASLLLEAALKIQSKKPNSKNKSFRVFGSFFKKLTQRNRSKKSENEENVSVKDILRWDSSIGRRHRKSFNSIVEEEENKGFEVCSCNGRPSCSGVWSESNEDKSLDMETSSSGHSCESVEEVEFVMSKKKENVDCACFDPHGFFCESPFRFALERSASSSSGRRTPEFFSPAESPRRPQIEDKENNGVDGVNKFQSVEDEDEKEQFSPVSVLDPLFEDYDDDDCHENDDDEGDFDMECSYANVQRSKQLLLDRLRRFEQLAELDPLELEKRMQEDNKAFEDDDYEEDEIEASNEEKALREIVHEILCHPSVHERWQDQKVLKRLVYDLIKEEEKELNFSQDMDIVMKRVCKKMELWKEVESNTIDMMIEEDFSREEIGWKKNAEETKELAGEVELAIFCLLVDEFSEELVC